MDNMMREMGGGMMEWDRRKEKSDTGQYDRTENSTANTDMRTSKEPPPASFYNQNGIRGLNEGIGEWAIRAFSRPSKAKPQGNLFAVIG